MITVKRALKKFREGRAAVFSQSPKGRGGSVFTASVLTKDHSILDERLTRYDVYQQLEIKLDTLTKAIHCIYSKMYPIT